MERKGFVAINQSEKDTRALSIYITPKINEYYLTKFPKYQNELKYLFDVYSDDEIQVLFKLLMRMYAGIDNLAERTAENEKE